MKKTATVRSLKVHTKVKAKFRKNDSFVHTRIEFGEIKLSGEWLNMWGFSPGDQVKVTCAHETLVITVDRNKMHQFIHEGKIQTAVSSSIKPFMMSLTRRILETSA